MAIQRIIDTEGVKTSAERGKGLGLVVEAPEPLVQIGKSAESR
jgi:hypothetical protein